jgi:hypothetical protein
MPVRLPLIPVDLQASRSDRQAVVGQKSARIGVHLRLERRLSVFCSRQPVVLTAEGGCPTCSVRVVRVPAGGLAESGTALSFSAGCGNRRPKQRGLARREDQKRRFRVREWWDCSTRREPLSRTRRPVCE